MATWIQHSRWIGWLAGLLLVAVLPVAAQQPLEPAARWDAAQDALAANRPEQAAELLAPLLQQDPLYTDGSDATAIYWLGEALRQAGRTDQAVQVWQHAIRQYVVAGRSAVALGLELIDLTFTQRYTPGYPFAADLYLQMLGQLHGATPAEWAALDVHLETLQWILPPDQRDALEAAQEARQAPPTLGEELVYWWKQQDLAPATEANERLGEHLERVAFAQDAYMFAGDFDDRAHVYVRLGEPMRKTSILFNSSRLRNKVIDRSLTINAFDFPENEYWYYEHLGASAQFLFHDTSGPFELGTTRDLLPPTLRNGYGSSARGQSKAQAAVRTLEEIYRQLALYHEDFVTRYESVSTFASMLDIADVASETAARLERDDDQINAGSGDPLRDALASSSNDNQLADTGMPGSVFSASRADLFVKQQLMYDSAEDQRTIQLRSDDVPQTYSNTFDALEPLSVHTRIARFLDPDGSTRTEVYWGTTTEAVAPSRQVRRLLRDEGMPRLDQTLLVATAVQQTATLQRRALAYQRLLVAPGGAVEQGWLLPDAPLVLYDDTTAYGLALQWDQYAVPNPSEVIPLRANALLRPEMQALDRDPATLTLSDLRPVLIDSDALAQADGHAAHRPYPFSFITADLNVGLYFEIYDLTFARDDLVRYTVEYSIRRKEGRRGRQTQQTMARVELTGTSRIARELVQLTLDEAARGDVEVVVRVTDQTTGATAERVIDFSLVR